MGLLELPKDTLYYVCSLLRFKDLSIIFKLHSKFFKISHALEFWRSFVKVRDLPLCVDEMQFLQRKCTVERAWRIIRGKKMQKWLRDTNFIYSIRVKHRAGFETSLKIGKVWFEWKEPRMFYETKDGQTSIGPVKEWNQHPIWKVMGERYRILIRDYLDETYCDNCKTIHPWFSLGVKTEIFRERIFPKPEDNYLVYKGGRTTGVLSLCYLYSFMMDIRNITIDEETIRLINVTC